MTAWTDVGEPSVLTWVVAGDAVQTGAWVIAGEPVQTMLTGEDYRVWIGEGAPSIVVGASVGDLYLDADSGMLYRLD